MLRRIAAIVAFLLALPAAVPGASLDPTPCDNYSKAETVFVGTLDGVSETDDWWSEIAKFTVAEHLKGDSETTLLVRAPRMLVHGSIAGQRWLVFANKSEEGLVMWHNSVRLLERSTALPLLRAFLADSEATYVRGTVLSMSGEPNVGVEVMVSPGNGISPLRSSSRGSFVLRDIPAGRYTFQALGDHGPSKEYTIDVGRCDATLLTLRVPRELPIKARMLSFAISLYESFIAMFSSDSEAQ